MNHILSHLTFHNLPFVSPLVLPFKPYSSPFLPGELRIEDAEKMVGEVA
jgi:hypothetical protein